MIVYPNSSSSWGYNKPYPHFCTIKPGKSLTAETSMWLHWNKKNLRMIHKVCCKSQIYPSISNHVKFPLVMQKTREASRLPFLLSKWPLMRWVSLNQDSLIIRCSWNEDKAHRASPFHLLKYVSSWIDREGAVLWWLRIHLEGEHLYMENGWFENDFNGLKYYSSTSSQMMSQLS